MKRWLLAGMCALAALSAVGCGSDEPSDSGTTAAKEPVTLTMWSSGVPDPKVMDELAAQFTTEHPNITVKIVQQPAATYFELVRSAIAKSDGPDIVGMYASPFTFDYATGLASLEDFITEEDRENVVGIRQGTTPEGEPLVFPMDAFGLAFYYDKAKFEKAGLDPEAPPTTWDELLTACDALKGAGIIPINGAFKDGGYLELLLMALMPQYLTDADRETLISDPDYTGPAFGKVIDLIKDLKARECFTPDSEAIPLFPDGANAFKSGKGGAIQLGFLGGDLYWKQFREETKWGKDGLGIFLPPVAPDSLVDEPTLVYGASGGFAVTKWSEHPQEAVEFMRYMASQDVQKRLFDEGGSLPANRTTPLESDDPVAQQIIEWINTKDALVSNFQVARANVEALFLKYAPQLFTGDMSYDEVAPELQAEQDRAAG